MSNERDTGGDRGPSQEMGPGDEAPPNREETAPNVCPACSGSGQREGARCERCGGTGEVQEAVGGG